MAVRPFLKLYNNKFHQTPFKCPLSSIHAYRRIDRRTDITEGNAPEINIVCFHSRVSTNKMYDTFKGKRRTRVDSEINTKFYSQRRNRQSHYDT